MTDILLGDDGDIDLSGGRMSVVSGAAALAQRIRLRLGTNRGEDLFDIGNGVPWLSELTAKNLADETLRAAIVAELETCPGVVSIDSVVVSDVPASRAKRVTLTVNGSTVVTV